jgi:hypothetical protein
VRQNGNAIPRTELLVPPMLVPEMRRLCCPCLSRVILSEAALRVQKSDVPCCP